MDSREKILDAATRLFSTQGSGAVSIAQVARSARVSKALIFWHFESKEQLFQAALDRSLEPFAINVEELEGLDEIGQVLRVVELYFEFIGQNLDSIRLALGLILRDDNSPEGTVDRLRQLFRGFGDLVRGAIALGREKGTVRSDVDPETEASLLRATLNGLLLQRLLGEEIDESDVRARIQGVVRSRLAPVRRKKA